VALDYPGLRGRLASFSRQDARSDAAPLADQQVHDPVVTAPHQAEITLDSIGDGVLSTDLGGAVTYLNVVAEMMTGWSRQAARGRLLDEVLHIVDRSTRQRAQDPMHLAVQFNRTVELAANCVLVGPDGRETEIEDSAAPIRDRDGHVTGAVMVFRNVGAALETSRQMSRLAHHDVLTGLPNRLLFLDRLDKAIALAQRRKKPLAVLFLDVDGFKGINDARGHAAGDLILQSVAGRLTASLRQSDTVSRHGGDEFVMILPEIEHAEDALLVARKLLRALTESHRIDSQDVLITASLGVALYPDHGLEAATLIANADTAMYEAKRTAPGTLHLSSARPGVSLNG
jgi:diguanylate cyclase (GGDEF)-like protein/PAS domain S-box-containing protein